MDNERYLGDNKNVPLTIGIPTFNRVKFLRRCIDSIVMQTPSPVVEILICDNASSDGTEEVVSEYIKNHSNIRYIRNSMNIGPDANALLCLRNGFGNFIHLMGDDDILEIGELEYILNFLKENPDLSAVILNWDHFKNTNGTEKYYWQMYPESQPLLFNSKEKFLSNVGLEGITFISNKIFNSSVFKQIQLPEKFIGTRFMQSYLLLQCLEISQNAAIIGKILIHQGVVNNLISQISLEDALYSALVVFHDKLYSILEYMEIDLKYDKNVIDKIFLKGIESEWKVLVLLRISYLIKPSISFGKQFNSYYKDFKILYYFGIILGLLPNLILKMLNLVYNLLC